MASIKKATSTRTQSAVKKSSTSRILSTDKADSAIKKVSTPAKKTASTKTKTAASTKASKSPAVSKKATKTLTARKSKSVRDAESASKTKPKSKTLGKVAGKFAAVVKKTATKKSATATKKFDPAAVLRNSVIKSCENLKAKDVVELDVRGKTSIADLIIIASGTSTRHVKSIADEVVKAAKQVGFMPRGVEGAREAEWVLVDIGDVVVHIMLPRVREFYALERLWTVGHQNEQFD